MDVNKVLHKRAPGSPAARICYEKFGSNHSSISSQTVTCIPLNEDPHPVVVISSLSSPLASPVMYHHICPSISHTPMLATLKTKFTFHHLRREKYPLM
mmetsp:Transcript_21207/g.49120  ORF Transcript_21207/g.49120 Transcript_21207/m.49120 type:complete len:98 (+) Transcript_21207:171-464(+)